jgi:UV DNA damage repair endonuclease
MQGKIGFACKWIDYPEQVNGIKATDDAKKYNTGSTTVAWLNRQTQTAAEEKLWDLMKQNIESTYQLVKRVSELDEHLRMVRISSDILPVYTHRDWTYFWRGPDVRLYAERAFAKIGLLARGSNVRLSFHPGQFTVLASDSDDIVSRSIEEFEYHADMARFMGYGQQFQDFKINVHIAGRRGPDGIRQVLQRLSPEARNTITIENEENAWGLEDVLTISDIVPITLDIHHHWIRTGEYIQTKDDRVLRVLESWRGVRPTCHYSVSREDWLPGHDVNTLPDYAALLLAGKKKQKLRAHSDFYWNTACNEWALGFLDNFDIMCESKGKNISSFNLYRQWKNGINHSSQ